MAKRMDSGLVREGAQGKPGRVPKKSPGKRVSSAKVKPAVKIGDTIKGGNSWHTGTVIDVGIAVIVCRDGKGFTFTKPQPGYEFPQYD